MGEMENLYNAACDLAEAGNFHEAIALFQKFTEIETGNPAGFELLAQCLLEVNDDANAYLAASKSVEVDPCWSSGFLVLGRAARNCGNLQAAIRAFTSCLEQIEDEDIRHELSEVQELRMEELSMRVGLPHLRIKEDFSCHSGPGCVVWECGVFLSWYLLNRMSTKIVAQHVLELGSGTGIASVTAALLGARVLATDTAAVLPALVRNLESHSNQVHSKGGSLFAQELDWSSPHLFKEFWSSPVEFDIVIGADLVYSNAQISSLSGVLGSLASRTKNKLVMIIVHKARDDAIEREFLNRCAEVGVVFNLIEVDSEGYNWNGARPEAVHVYQAIIERS